MICQHCNTTIDDDLVFCTNCGQRLFQPGITEAPTVVQSRAPQTAAATYAESPRKSRALLWVGLIAGILFIVPATIGVIYLLTRQKPVAIANNSAKTPAPTKSPTPKSNLNQNWNATPSSTPTPANTAPNNTANSSADTDSAQEIVKERIELEPNSHYALPFSSDGNRDIVGTVKVVRGGEIKGFVFSQEMYDEHFPDETYKVFSVGPGRNFDIKQRLVEEDYVLVFVNDSDKPCMIETDVVLK